MSKRASVLAVALWSLCLLSTFAVYLGFGVRQKLILVSRLDTRERLRFIASAGIKMAILELRRKDGNSGFDGLNESWGNNKELFDHASVGEGTFTVAHEPLYMESTFNQKRYGAVDEERKININTVKRPVLEKLLELVAGLDESEAQDLSATIVDWRDKDSQLSTPLGSAEDSYYQELRDSYEAKDDDFEVPNELFLVKGITRETFEAIKDYITIYGSGQININTASAKVLEALGLYRSVIDKILFFRCGQDKLEATVDDNVFTSSASIVPQLSQLVALGEGEIANLSNMIASGIITTSSTNFMIKSTGELSDTGESLQIVCVFERPTFLTRPLTGEIDARGKIRYWQEKTD
ncbi:MAG: hypothetical protein V1727_01030 [Candidatus Omnitrophota bacterium]